MSAIDGTMDKLTVAIVEVAVEIILRELRIALEIEVIRDPKGHAGSKRLVSLFVEHREMLVEKAIKQIGVVHGSKKEP